jgi:hypothetical protein
MFAVGFEEVSGSKLAAGLTGSRLLAISGGVLVLSRRARAVAEDESKVHNLGVNGVK